MKSLLDIVRDSYSCQVSTSGECHQGRDKIKTDLAFTCCYLITKVRGFKNILRHFPHEVADVESVMEMISAEGSNRQNELGNQVRLVALVVCFGPHPVSI